jgi:nucleotide-binding universal stress UspA family protein
VKLIVACDGRDLPTFFAALTQVIPLSGSEVILAHVVDSGFEEGWQLAAGHRLLGHRPGSRQHTQLQRTEEDQGRAILAEALNLSSDWPVTARDARQLTGNPERELVRLALAEHADVIVLGQHRLELGPHALGRCARFVVDHAPCSVLLVRDETLRAEAPTLLGNRLRDHGGPRP